MPCGAASPTCTWGNSLARAARWSKRIESHSLEIPRMSGEGFLAAIRAAPDDDTPRLVYADWLDEHGDPDRAEFIRVQVELARLAQDDPRRPELMRGERTL